MNETIANSTSSLRTGKDLSLDSPLLNLILAASLLSKITRSKSTPPSYARTPPFPLRYSENYYNTLPWYPHNAQHYYKLQTSLSEQQATFPFKQHIIHIHQKPIKKKPEVVSSRPTTTLTSIKPVETPEDPVNFVSPIKNDTGIQTNLASENLADEISPSFQLTEELKDFLINFLKKNYLKPIAEQDLETSAATQSDFSADEVKFVDFSEALPGIDLEQISEEIVDNITRVTSNEMVENMSETLVDNMADNLPENATKSDVQQMSLDVLQNLPSSILQNIPSNMLKQISEKISEQIIDKLSEKFSKDVSNHMLEKLAQLIPNRTAKPAEPGKVQLEDNSEENKVLEFSNNVDFIEDKKISQNEKTHENLSNDRELSNLVSAASNIDLQTSESQKTNSGKFSKNTRTTDDEYVFGATGNDEDDDEDEEDILDEPQIDIEQSLPQRVSSKFSQKMRFSIEEPGRKGSKGKTSNQQSQERINSKKPSSKRKTTPISLIYDEYEESTATQLPPKRRVQFYNGAAKKSNSRKPSRPSHSDYTDETELKNDKEDSVKPQRQVQNKKEVKNKSPQRKRTTTTTQTYTDDYYNDPVDSDQNREQYSDQDQTQDYNDEPSTPKARPSKVTRRPVLRQQGTTTELPTTTEVTTFPPTGTSTAATSTTTQASNTTSGEYPYYGGNNYNNISITYGPPVDHYGYGPSNGNEQISFTYAPSSNSGVGNLGGFTGMSGGGASASGVAPMVDNWYNQYAKASMYQRIHDLLTPNNFYNQYDVNYHEGSVQ